METQIITSNTQVERAAVLLKSLKHNVTKADRKEAQKKFTVGAETVSRYLNGKSDLMDSDLAISLIQFFNKRIDGREKLLNATTNL